MSATRFASWSRAGLIALLAAGVGPAFADDPSLAGRWDATVVVNDLEVPFTFEIVEEAGELKGAFFNGDLKITSTVGRFEHGTLALGFEQYASKIEATYRDGRLEGQYLRGSRAPYGFRAVRATRVAPTPGAPAIDGVWRIPTKSNKGEVAWRFIVRQSGGDVSGAILRVDGDTGNLTGAYRDGTFVMSHFSGARPLLLEVTANDDGSLTLLQNRQTTLVAVREDSARAKEIGDPTDPSAHTAVRDPNEPFRFSFPDLDGNLVTNEDSRFAGKVVLVSITGSWCPNCHDEAPFLSKLFKTYKDKGLEIVALSFEEGDQLTNPTRLRAFIRKYDLPYTFLLAGVPDELNEKVPQGVNLNAFPTTFVIGRDGRVRGAHAGFPSPGSGEFYTEAVAEMTAEVERLLAEPAPKSF
jgi:peroxiredoxin